MTDAHAGLLLQLRLTLPYDRIPPGLSANDRAHWSQKAKSTRQVRADVTTLAKAAGLHRYEPGRVDHVTVALVWAPGDRRRRDDDNLAPMLKAAADAIARGGRADLIGIDLVADDTARWMTKTCRIEPPPAKGMWLDLELRLAIPEASA